MHNRQTFLYRPWGVIDRRGDGGGQPGGVLDVPVKARRPQGRQIRPARGRGATTKRTREAGDPMLPRKTPKAAPGAPVPKPTQAGG